MLFGITGYCYLSSALLLSTRIRILDRLVGHDRIIRVHGYLASAGIISGIIHLFFKLSYISGVSFHTVSGGASLVIFSILLLMTFIYMIEKIYIPLPGLKTLKSFIIKNFNLDYSVMKNLHNGFSLALFFLIVHVLLSYSTSETLFRFYIMALPGTVSLIRYIYFKFIKIHYLKKNQFYVKITERNTPSVISINLEPLNKKLSFRAGQYIYLSIISSEIQKEEHPFTIASSPSVDSLTITASEIGDYTKKLLSVKEGDKALVDGPYGLFTPVNNSRKKIFIAGGIGITPFLSVLKEWETEENIPQSALLWSLRLEKDIIDREFLVNLSKKRDWFSYTIFLTREKVPGFKHGRISLEDLKSIFSSGNSSSFDVYICGTEDFRNSLRKKLSMLGIPQRNIYFESFSS
ncbi:MAG: hypothetical protein RBT69_05545 [Spirochaetia bacterium]|jgi:predicted ferric reductase|nr:hypothetical protein [Spirochaetia bacterium]